MLTPIALDPAHPFPFVASGSLNIAALLDTDDPEEPERLAVVQVPRVLPRVIARARRRGRIALLRLPRRRDPLAAAAALPGAPRSSTTRPSACTRNTNLYVDEEEIENLLTAIEQELRRRRRGEAVRLEVRAPVGERLAAGAARRSSTSSAATSTSATAR